jgi:hypothetical protein
MRQSTRFFTILSAALFLFSFSIVGAGAQKQAGKPGAEPEGEPETSTAALLQHFSELEAAPAPHKADTNGDGMQDYYAQTNQSGAKVMEVMDFNHDGKMDDFYFYENGILQRRAVDSNYDEQIDLWVYLRGGVYIERYLRDADYNGSFETVKEFEDAGGEGTDESGGSANGKGSAGAGNG